MNNSLSAGINTPQSLKVLVIEDSEDDLLLLIRELKKGGYHPEYDRIETADAMMKAVSDKAWDVILCDYKMPQFSAPSALSLLKEENVDIPVIIVSGTIGEEKAVECMRLGARDYIIKGNYSRLCPVIARELEETIIRKQHQEAESQKEVAQEGLRRSEEKYRKIAKCSPDLIWTMNLSGRFIYVSEAVERTHGWTVDEFMNLSLQDLVSPQQLNRNIVMMSEQIVKAGEPDFDHNSTLTYESEELRKDGSTFLAEVTASFLWSDDGKPVGIIGITRDITERRKAEEKLRRSEELQTKLVNAMPDVVVRTDLEGNILFVNDNAVQIAGYSKDEFLGQNLLKFIAPEHHEQVLQNLQFMRNGRLGIREYNLLTKDGRRIMFEIDGDVLRNEDGTPFAVVHVCRDITERKRTEKILRERDEQLRGITENLPGVIFQFYAKDDGEYGINYVSEPKGEFSKIMENLNLTNADNLFQLFLSRVHKEDRDSFITSIETAAKKVGNWNFEGRVELLTGKNIWLQGLSTPTRQENQTIFNGMLLNITERKMAEEQSRLSEDKFYKIFMTTPDCIALTRLNDGLILDVNKGFEDIVGWKREYVIGQKSTGPPFFFWMDSTESDFLKEELKAGRDILHREFKFKRSDGSQRFGNYSARSITIDEQQCVIFILQDITERKALDAELKRTMEGLRKSVGTTIQVMISAIEMRDPYTAGHQLRVADLARAIATEMRLSSHTIDGIRMAGTIHDIGKLSIPAEILTKPSKLTKIEYSIVQEHVQSGYDILKNVESPWPLAEMVYQHHERINGSGYPRNLRGNEIIPEARILAVADVVEAMASHRPYRASLGIESSLSEIEKNKGMLYDEAVADACIRLFRDKGYVLS